ncbi:hypothetical protein TNCV_1887731 [Trichonephila clavipes]|nr:hypothetical protein TNCV_1887731 [Trichonephila clavipes]
MMANIEFETVATTVAGLKSVKTGLEKLYNWHATWLTAEDAFSLVIGELKEQNSEFEKSLDDAKRWRIVRRQEMGQSQITYCWDLRVREMWCPLRGNSSQRQEQGSADLAATKEQQRLLKTII